MAKYAVDIVEELRKTVWCEANSPQEAEKKVREAYKKGQVVLDADNLDDMDITIPELVEDDNLALLEDYMEVK